MNPNTKAGVLMIATATVATAGHFVSVVPEGIAYIVAAPIIAGLALISLDQGDTIGTVGLGSISGAFLIAGVTTYISFVLLTYLGYMLLLVGGAVGVYNVVSSVKS